MSAEKNEDLTPMWRRCAQEPGSRKVTGMEIPAKVSLFNRTLEVKGKPGTLISINEGGYYEVILEVQQRNHTVLFPIAETVLIFNDAVPPTATEFEVER